MSETSNPLLGWRKFPDYRAIEPEHVVPAVTATLEKCEAMLAELETSPPQTWIDLMVPLEKLTDELDRVWGVVGHLHQVRNSPELRAAYRQAQPEVVKFSNRLGQSRPLYEAYCRLRDGREFGTYDAAQRRILSTAIRDAELSGVALQGEKRERFNEISRRLAELSTQFSNNVLDATKDYKLVLRDRADVEGLPPSLLGQALEAAKRHGFEDADGETGPWVITLEVPSFLPFMQHSRRRDLREQLYRAYVSRAAEPPIENLPLIDEILRLREEMASLLGFGCYADVSLRRKMAPDVPAVDALLHRLRDAARPHGENDLDELRKLASDLNADEATDLAHWDVPFWAERLREDRFGLEDEKLRPFFPLPHVLRGLFLLAEKLFGVRVEEADGEAPTWHDDVRFFRLYDTGRGEQVASLYLDPYSRPAEKRGGAWMNSLVGRSAVMAAKGERVRLPVAYIVSNQTPPVGDRPSLMTFGEVRTLFHEFGHALQHMLTQVDYGMAAGVENVEWDAVELASQFMENWLFHRPTLTALAEHYETGEPLPEEMIDKLIEARTFRAGSNTLRQVNLGLFDMELHARYRPDETRSPLAVQHEIARATLPMKPLAEDRYLCSFLHIFTGAYAAGYYSYKWAEVLSADAFSAFEEAGLDDEAITRRLGRRFRETVLSLGGSRDPMEVFRAFRGREPDPEALLRHCGLN